MPMISSIPVIAEAGGGTVSSSTPELVLNRPRLVSLWLLSTWCGLVAGLLEVVMIVLRKQVFDPDHLYKISRHFVWLIPISNLVVFSTLGLIACGIIAIWPRRGRWLFARALCALAFLPALLAAFPRIYCLAWVVVALGTAARLVPRLERHSRVLRRSVLVSIPALISVVAILGVSPWMGDRIMQEREGARPLPPPGSPNVLLIVMDSVAAGHLSLHGYERATSTTLLELAERGVRFESARATCSWTLPSHASMFTGRWLHELSVGWLTPLDRTCPTLAAYLGERGYATAGFVANMFYCAADSGLSRGFTHYRDFIFPELTALKTAVLVNRALEGLQDLADLTKNWLEYAGLRPYVQRLWRSLVIDRKGAAVVNRELLDWLSRRTQPNRPFFAFLNYYDAHYPYQLTPGRPHRFGAEPADNSQRSLIQHWWEIDKRMVSQEGVAFATDSYDDCVADLDEQIGKLVDELDRRGILEHTWLIITSDHGESFGEHPGIFCHGESLYETELHVPLLVVPPGGGARKQVIKDPVSLRDLAATIVDVIGLESGSPFAGVSMGRLWQQPSEVSPVPSPSLSPSLAEVVPNDPQDRNSWGIPRPLPPLGAVKEKDWSYIRQNGDGREELFHLQQDPKERHNLAADSAARATLERMRESLGRLTAGPLTHRRFNP
jgi:arylsulfatase A-like enzyme